MLTLDDGVVRARLWGELMQQPKGSILDTSGKRHEYVRDAGWSDLDLRLLGKVTDLKSAYKQLPLHPAHRSFNIISVKNPATAKQELFVSQSLMFGQTTAVYGFL
eukprot:10391039-Karenia_brevis.AAC.1